MLWVLLIAAGLWFVGRALGASVAARVAVLVMLLAAVLFVQLALPPENPLRAATGGSARAWAILLGAAGVAIAYVWGLRLLRRRVAPAEKAPPQPGVLSDSELDRYARHIVLREIGGPGQRRLKQARVLVVGAGGLGAPALLYLGAAGVGTLGVIDDDTVSVSNLQRQVIHTDARQGTAKVFSAARRAGLAAGRSGSTAQHAKGKLTARERIDSCSTRAASRNTTCSSPIAAPISAWRSPSPGRWRGHRLGHDQRPHGLCVQPGFHRLGGSVSRNPCRRRSARSWTWRCRTARR
jgi:hypothetical protein